MKYDYERSNRIHHAGRILSETPSQVKYNCHKLLYIITPAGTGRDLLSELVNQLGQPCRLVLSHLEVLFNRDCLREGRERRCTIAYTSLAL